MDLALTRTLILSDETPASSTDGGPPLRRIAVVGIVKNPLAGMFGEDLSEMITASELIGRQLAERAVEAMQPFQIVSYGKGGIVGTAGQQEHVNALLTTTFATPLREAIGGAQAWISSFTKRGGPGTSVDVPMAHKDALYVRSHYDGMTVTIPDGPQPDEIALIICVANRGRIDARVGGLRAEDVEGKDGLH